MILMFQLLFHYFKLQLKRVKSEMNQRFTTTEQSWLNFHRMWTTVGYFFVNVFLVNFLFTLNIFVPTLNLH
jgi:hypothetical protein